MKVLVTTDSNRRGVFFGELDPSMTPQQVIETGVCALTSMRNCVYWSKSVGGVFGLAECGPDANCKIGAKVTSKSWLNGVTYIAEVAEEAAQAWEGAPCLG